MKRIACFVTPHGLGHAARAAAVMDALQERIADLHFDIYTTVAEAFFAASLRSPFTYHRLDTDLGLVQKTVYEEDLAATIKQLDAITPYAPARMTSLARRLREDGCELVICDIAPMGIMAAREAGIRSVLIENFTWDWIYAGYLDSEPAFEKHVRYFGSIFASTDVHIQTAPACLPTQADLQVPVVGRKVREARHSVRERLGVPESATTVLFSLNQLSPDAPAIQRLLDLPGVYVVIPSSDAQPHRHDRVLQLPHQSAFFHPDLVNAADIVIGKVGYSTLAEVFHAGAAFGYVPRSRFRESPILEAFIRTRMVCHEIPEREIEQGDWVDAVPALSLARRPARDPRNGADVIADYLLQKA